MAELSSWTPKNRAKAADTYSRKSEVGILPERTLISVIADCNRFFFQRFLTANILPDRATRKKAGNHPMLILIGSRMPAMRPAPAVEDVIVRLLFAGDWGYFAPTSSNYTEWAAPGQPPANRNLTMYVCTGHWTDKKSTLPEQTSSCRSGCLAGSHQWKALSGSCEPIQISGQVLYFVIWLRISDQIKETDGTAELGWQYIDNGKRQSDMDRGKKS